MAACGEPTVGRLHLRLPNAAICRQFPLLEAGLIGLVRVEWRGYSYPARSILGSNDLVGVAFEADPRSVVVEVLQHEAAYPDAGYLNVGHDVGRAYGLNPRLR